MKLESNNVKTFGQLEELLNSHPAITNTERPETKGAYFNREFEFEIRGVKYKIEWYVNLMTLFIGEFEMLFDEVIISSTVPRRFKGFLQFYYKGNWVADIPLERW